MERVASMAKAAVHKARLYCSSIRYFRVPTFDDFDIVLAEKISILRGKVGRGDIVIMVSPEQSKFLIKRIKAVGGDVVSYAPFNNRHRGYTDLNKTLVVPNGHVWVEGDYLLDSRDSRHFDAVPYGYLRYRVFAVVWPPRDCRLIRNKIE
ncbi:mitochondrial inner membrane protease subunit 1-like isoform X2 [Salvia splendens]|uniref:mitochondrial inner membrane protease subunit 1-like isoform X2 n=1 Tax=Salvia splendens TaxID=180675 RepID=UPI001C2688D1|nr:mitochondrial inner membrane protease subunit 1-like isoform X2 [Salvia splendens]XP_041992951.1 mitochondrial inner membrane protease subunit 1-like isoform X2 [Salvia splendens]